MTKRIKLRTLLIGGLMTLLFVILVVRVYIVQVVDADFWYGQAKKTWSASEKLIPARGMITDKDGNVLAMDVAAYDVAVNPKVIQTLGLEDRIVSKFHTLLGKSNEGLRNIMEAKQKNGEYYEQREIHSEGWKIDKDLADRVKAFREELRKETKKTDVGIYLMEDQKRYYPKNSMASHVIGYLDKEGNAIMGLEASFDKELRGTAGYLKYEKDGRQVQLDGGEVDYKPAVDGKNLTLTLDADIQYYVENAIKEAYDKYQPLSITAIAVDPNTMDILGMANLPDFNPNTYWKTASQANFYDHSIKSLYEPGSTFKIVTLAGAVQEGLFDPNETYKSGAIKVADSWLHDYKHDGWGTISFLEGLKRSSNVAFVKLGYEKLGAAKLMEYIHNLGFGQKTGIGLNGEIAGSVSYKYEVEKATMTYGQGKVQVTPIQQIAAISAIANGGKLMVPHLVKKIEDPVTKKTTIIKPEVVRQVISEESSKKTGEYLEQVVSDQEIGTGRNAYIEGYRVAGKTGTANKVIDGKYAEDKYVVSFIGYAPVNDPKIAVYVVLDEPNDPYAGGGSNAAPVFKKIVQQSLRHMGVAPVIETKTEQASKQAPIPTAPDVTELTVTQAKEELSQRGLDVEVVGKGSKVIQQIPKAGTSVVSKQRIYLITEKRVEMAIPNLRGLSLRDALEVCSLLELRCITEGEGFVQTQTLAKQNGDRVLKLVLAPPGGANTGSSGNGSEGAAPDTVPTTISP